MAQTRTEQQCARRTRKPVACPAILQTADRALQGGRAGFRRARRSVELGTSAPLRHPSNAFSPRGGHRQSAPLQQHQGLQHSGEPAVAASSAPRSIMTDRHCADAGAARPNTHPRPCPVTILPHGPPTARACAKKSVATGGESRNLLMSPNFEPFTKISAPHWNRPTAVAYPSSRFGGWSPKEPETPEVMNGRPSYRRQLVCRP